MQVFVFEGPDGAGKSSTVQAIKEKLESGGHKVVIFRQPGGTAVGEKFRELLLDRHTPMLPITQAYMFAASRYETLKEVERVLKEDPKTIILMDRWNISTMVYQNTLDELEHADKDYLETNKNEIEAIGLLSAMTKGLELEFFYLTANLDILLKRRPIDQAVDRFEIGGFEARLSIFNKYEEYYETLKETYPIHKLMNNEPSDQQKIVDKVCLRAMLQQ